MTRIAEVAASTTYISPGPLTAIRSPDSAGPVRTASSRDGFSSAKACGSCRLGTRAGISALRAGWSNAAAAVVSTTETSTSQVVIEPARLSADSAAETARARPWLHCSRRRRSRRSAYAPASGLRTTRAIACANPTRPVCASDPDSA